MSIAKMFDEGKISGEAFNEADMFSTLEMDLDLDETDGEEGLVESHKDLDIIDEVEAMTEDVGKQMMAGKRAKDIFAIYKKTASKETMDKQVVNFIKSNDGLLGTVILDCHLVANSEKLAKLMALSPYKKFAQYVVNCDCGCEEKISREEIVSDSTNSIDAALGQQYKEVVNAAICNKTGLPVLKNIKAYTKQDAECAIKGLVTLGSIDKTTAKTILSSNDSPLIMVKKAFQTFFYKKDLESAQKYSEKVDDSGFKMKASKMAIDLQDAVEGDIVVSEQPCAIVVNVEDAQEQLVPQMPQEDFDLEEPCAEQTVIELDNLKDREDEVSFESQEDDLEIDTDEFIDDYFEKDDLNFEIADQVKEDDLDVDTKSLFDIDLNEEK